MWSLFFECAAAKKAGLLLSFGTREQVKDVPNRFRPLVLIYSFPHFLLVVDFSRVIFSHPNSSAILISNPTLPLFLAPVFDYEDIPSPLSETESTITVLLRPALARGAPVR